MQLRVALATRVQKLLWTERPLPNHLEVLDGGGPSIPEGVGPVRKGKGTREHILLGTALRPEVSDGRLTPGQTLQLVEDAT